MKPEEVKEYINHALASSRGLTSDLASDIVRKMDIKIKESIETTVNGKINNLHSKIDVYIDSDNAWKKEVTPIIETMRKQQNFFSVGGSAMKGFILIGAVISAAVAGVHYIKEWINQ